LLVWDSRIGVATRRAEDLAAAASRTDPDKGFAQMNRGI
jgi:hypothetical protein